MTGRATHRERSKKRKREADGTRTLFVFWFGSRFDVFAASSASAQEEPLCGPDIKFEVATILDQSGYHDDPSSKESVALKEALFEAYSFCLEDVPPVSEEAYCGELSLVASTFYERMRCCGYDPQKRLFACPVEILQRNGYGAPPFPGSYQYVLTCVDFGGGFVPVADDRVHLANERYGFQPTWNFAVVAEAYDELASQPLKGQTFVARSILSWNTMPTSCEDEAIIWGNAVDYQIRLDP
ncbi:MAG: hypothetical protein AAF735_06380 [Myxococcota bacterium]